MHPSRSHNITQNPVEAQMSPNDKPSRKFDKSGRRKLTLQDRAAFAEEKRKEEEQNQKEREKKMRLREKKRRDLRKMTSKGQPVMKTRLEDLLGKVKKVMKDA